MEPEIAFVNPTVSLPAAEFTRNTTVPWEGGGQNRGRERDGERFGMRSEEFEGTPPI